MVSSRASASSLATLRRHAHRLVEAGSIPEPQCQPSGDGLLAGSGCLPGMAGLVMEGVVRGEAPGRVNGPRVEQLRSFARQPEGEVGTPIVADQVDRFTDHLELPGQPGHVVVIGCTEAIGQRRAEARRGQGHGVISSQFGDERRPDAAVSGLPLTRTSVMPPNGIGPRRRPRCIAGCPAGRSADVRHRPGVQGQFRMRGRYS